MLIYVYFFIFLKLKRRTNFARNISLMLKKLWKILIFFEILHYFGQFFGKNDIGKFSIFYTNYNYNFFPFSTPPFNRFFCKTAENRLRSEQFKSCLKGERKLFHCFYPFYLEWNWNGILAFVEKNEQLFLTIWVFSKNF